MSNDDVLKVRAIANKILYTPEMRPIDVIDELDELSRATIIDGSFGILVRSIISEVHTNLKRQ